MRTLSSTAALLATATVVAYGCKRVNGAYCDDTRPCAAGFSCDLVARECQPTGGGGSGGDDMSVRGSEDLAGCPVCSGATPLCAANTCIACTSTSDGENQCALQSPSTPHCAPDGSCVGCRNAGDCGGATPFCDSGTRTCRGCVSDGECPSLICDLVPGSSTRGQCVPPSNVVYADGVNGNDNNSGLSASTATKTIMKAVNIAVGLTPPRLYVHIGAATYNESVGVNNATISLVGASGATIHPTGGGDGLGCQGSKGSLVARNLVVSADSGNGGNCSNQCSSYAVYRTQLINASQIGLYASSTCGNLVVDGCWINGNMQGGISVASKFTIINSIITHNVGGGVNQLGTATTQLFVNDTVADNTSGALNAGVNCLTGSGFAVVNSILYDNKSAGTVSETNCMGSFDASDDPSTGPESTVDLTLQSPMFKSTTPLSPDSYHLLPGSKCVDEGTPMGAPDHDFDFEARPDANDGHVDIGADEVH